MGGALNPESRLEAFAVPRAASTTTAATAQGQSSGILARVYVESCSVRPKLLCISFLCSLYACRKGIRRVPSWNCSVFSFRSPNKRQSHSLGFLMITTASNPVLVAKAPFIGPILNPKRGLLVRASFPLFVVLGSS